MSWHEMEADVLGTVGWTQRSTVVPFKLEDIQTWKHQGRKSTPRVVLEAQASTLIFRHTRPSPRRRKVSHKAHVHPPPSPSSTTAHFRVRGRRVPVRRCTSRSRETMAGVGTAPSSC
eukprot:scaffold2636_cov340-Pavlova_lutheri.AAC.40